MRYLFHLGFHKTGTSFLQRKLFSSGTEEFQPVILKGSSLEQNTKASKAFGGCIIREAICGRDILQDQLRTRYDFSLDKINVVSNEALSGSARTGFSAKWSHLEFIKNSFPDAKILIGIREQSSWIRSMYYQYLRMGGTLAPADYLKESLSRSFSHSFVQEHLYYDQFVQRYADAFGRENVCVYAHEELISDPQSVFMAIAEFVDIEIDLGNFNFKERVNEKLSLSSLELLRILSPLLFSVHANGYSRLGILRSERKREAFMVKLNALMPKFFEAKLVQRLNDSFDKICFNGYRASNNILFELLGRDYSEFGYKI